MEFSLLPHLTFPRLRSLRLPLQSGATPAIDQSRADFIAAHPTIEELSWYPIGPVTLPPGALPRIRRLRSGQGVVEALMEASQPSTESPESESEVPTTDRASESTPAPARRKLEYIDTLSLSTPTLLSLSTHTLSPTSLLGLRLHTLSSLPELRLLASTFPNLTWLQVPHLYYVADTPREISIEEWMGILPMFGRLRVFRGAGLWSAVDMEKERMHGVIGELVEKCGRLREMDYWAWCERRGGYRRIVVIREGEGEEERVRYEVRRALPRCVGFFFPFLWDGKCSAC